MTGHALALVFAVGKRCVYRRQEWKVAMLTLIGRGKKVKFRGIFRDKFAEKAADFAGMLQKNSRQISPKDNP